MKSLSMIAALAVLAAATPAVAGKAKTAIPVKEGELGLYQDLNYNGDIYTIDRDNSSVKTDWNIRSIGVFPGDKWQICAKARYKEPCIVLDRSVADAKLIGIEGQIGSARKAPGSKGAKPAK